MVSFILKATSSSTHHVWPNQVAQAWARMRETRKLRTLCRGVCTWMLVVTKGEPPFLWPHPSIQGKVLPILHSTLTQWSGVCVWWRLKQACLTQSFSSKPACFQNVRILISSPSCTLPLQLLGCSTAPEGKSEKSRNELSAILPWTSVYTASSDHIFIMILTF